MKVIGLKLVNGEEIIGRVTYEPQNVNEFYKLEKVRQLQPIVFKNKKGEDQIVVSLIPWVLGNPDGEVFISPMNIMTSINVLEGTVNDYLSDTTDIAVNKGSKILL